MVLTRTDTQASVTLPDDLYWEDEHASLVTQTVEPSLTGAALIQEASRQYREMTLRPWANDASWVSRATVETLRSWSDLPDLPLALTRRAITYSLRFRHSAGALAREPVSFYENDTGVASQDPQYLLTLRFWVLG